MMVEGEFRARPIRSQVLREAILRRVAKQAEEDGITVPSDNTVRAVLSSSRRENQYLEEVGEDG